MTVGRRARDKGFATAKCFLALSLSSLSPSPFLSFCLSVCLSVSSTLPSRSPTLLFLLHSWDFERGTRACERTREGREAYSEQGQGERGREGVAIDLTRMTAGRLAAQLRHSKKTLYGGGRKTVVGRGKGGSCNHLRCPEGLRQSQAEPLL